VINSQHRAGAASAEQSMSSTVIINPLPLNAARASKISASNDLRGEKSRQEASTTRLGLAQLPFQLLLFLSVPIMMRHTGAAHKALPEFFDDRQAGSVIHLTVSRNTLRSYRVAPDGE